MAAATYDQGERPALGIERRRKPSPRVPFGAGNWLETKALARSGLVNGGSRFGVIDCPGVPNQPENTHLMAHQESAPTPISQRRDRQHRRRHQTLMQRPQQRNPLRPHRRQRQAIGGALALAVVLTACSTGSDASDPSAAPEAEADQPQLSAAAVAESEASLDAIVERIQQESGVPGIAVGVVYDGEPVIAKGYGVTEAGTDSAVSADTVFQLASVSKPVGAAAVAEVVGRGDISWNQPVVTELPEFRLSSAYVTENATVADFYSHRTGLPGDTAGNDLEAIGYDQEEILTRLQYLPLEPFRATYSYSNFGMTVGATAAAAAYGAPFAQMAEEVLFEPAGMTSTSFSYDDFLAEPDTATLHVKIDGEFTPGFERTPDPQAPAGGLSSNVTDMNRWLLLQLDEGQLDGEQIINAEALAETKRSHINSRPAGDPGSPAVGYGLGWNVSQSMVDPALVQWSHSGAFSAGAATTVRALPELDLGVVVLTNAQPVGAAEAIADTYIDTVLNGEPTQDWVAMWGEATAGLLDPPPVEQPANPAPAREDAAYVGTYANDYYGEAEVRAGPDGLELVMGPDGTAVFPLQPLDGDRFTFVDAPEVAGLQSVLAFDFSGDAPSATALVMEETAIFGANSEAATWTVLPRV